MNEQFKKNMKNNLSGSGDFTGEFKEGGFSKWDVIDWGGLSEACFRDERRGYAAIITWIAIIIGFLGIYPFCWLL